jgi:hypothetical protein
MGLLTPRLPSYGGLMKSAACGLFLASLCLFGNDAVFAQLTIFNVPTTDIVDKGQAYFEFDYLLQIPKPSGMSRLSVYDPRLIVGAGSGVEVGINVNSLHRSGTTNVFLQPNIKWRFFDNKTDGIAAAAGGIFYAHFGEGEIGPTYGLLYAEMSKKVKSGTHAPRFHAGTYGVVHAGSSWVGPKAGAFFGYEQPIQSKASIVADWLTGKNAFGYFTPGLSFTLPMNSVFNAGYSFGNDSFHGNDNRFLSVYYGITF